MKSATSRRFRRLPELERLDRRLTRDWDLRADAEATVSTAREMIAVVALRASDLDLDRHYWCVSHGAEGLWDCKQLDDASRLVKLWRQAVTNICNERELDPNEPRIWAAILSARVEHRHRRYSLAVEYAHQALAEIQELAGGRDAIRELLALGGVDPVSEMYCAALAIAIPAGRMRFQGHPVWRAQFLDRWVSEALLLLDRDVPPKLIRIHALVIQTFYALCEEDPSPDNTRWLDRLELFDDLVRPGTRRGQATRPLRDVARADHDGDKSRLSVATDTALGQLANLPRHIEVLTANRWWPITSPASAT